MVEKDWSVYSTNYFPSSVLDLQNLLQINTVYDENTVTEEQPFGAGIQKGLSWLKEKAEKDRFIVRNFDNQALAISIGKQKNRIEAVGHIDVVSVSEDWTHPPFSGIIEDGKLYGRGTQDMKTQVWLLYTALRMIKDAHLDLKRQIRLVIGTDEERSMNDIRYYLSKEGLPDFAFTPDGAFPVCLGEKGVLTLEISKSVRTRIHRLRTFQFSNIICDKVEVVLPIEDCAQIKSYLNMKSIPFEYVDFGKFFIFGKAAHSSQPEKGINAIISCLKMIYDLFEEKWAGELFNTFNNYYGENIGLKPLYEPMGYTSVCLNQLFIKNQSLTGIVDHRYTAPLSEEKLLSLYKRKLSDYKVEKLYHDPITQTDLQNSFVQTLIENYRDYFPEDDSEPYYSGGVTYSKVYDGRCVAYGIKQEKSKIPDRAHQVDEYIPLDGLEKLCCLYADTLAKMANK